MEINISIPELTPEELEALKLYLESDPIMAAVMQTVAHRMAESDTKKALIEYFEKENEHEQE